MFQFARSQQLGTLSAAAHDSLLDQSSQVHHRIFFKTRQFAEVDGGVLFAPLVIEAAQLGQTLRQRQLATFKDARDAGAGPRLLSLLALAAGLALPGGDTAANALPLPVTAR